MATITYKACPGCSSGSIHLQLAARDFTVTQGTFEIWECADCSLRFTQHVPDADSIGEYYQSDTYISHSDTQQGIVNKLYHLVRKRTLQHKRQLVQKTTGLSTGTIADIGAGIGAFAHAMQQADWQVTALEPDEGARQRAHTNYGLSLQPAGTLYTLPEGTFDAITLWHVLEHVHDLHAYVEQIQKILKPHGRALIAVPNYTSYDAEVYQSYWAAYDVPRHLYHFSPIAMERLMQQHQLKIIGVKPMWFDSFYVAMLSEQYKKGSNNLLKAIWVGLVSNMVTLFNKRRCSSVVYVVGREKV